MKYNEYLDYLVNKTYKILAMKENNVLTLKSYMENFIRELIGNQWLLEKLKKEPCYFTLISKINYLIENDPSVGIYKKDVFECIRIIKDIQKRMVGD